MENTVKVTSATFENQLKAKVDEINARLKGLADKLAHEQNNEHERNVLIVESGYSSKDDTDLKAIENNYILQKQREIFESCDTAAAVIIAHGFKPLTHKAKKEKGSDFVTKLEIVDGKYYFLDLKKYCEDRCLSTDWYSKALYLSKLYAMNVAKRKGLSDEVIRDMDDTFVTNRLINDYKEGKTPASNSQVIKKTQEVFDMIMSEFSEEERKKAKKITTKEYDHYIECYTKMSPNDPFKVMFGAPKSTIGVLMTIFNTLLTQNSLGVEWKKVK